MGKDWTTTEIRHLKDGYSTKCAKTLARELGRSVGSIRSQIQEQRFGGKKHRDWCKEEIELLKKHFKTKSGRLFLAKELQRTPTAIRVKAAKLGLIPKRK